MLVDSHCHLDHLDLEPFNGDLNQVIQAAKDLGVEHILNVCVDLDNFPTVLAIAKQFDNVHASVGLHPAEAAGVELKLETLIALTKDPKVIAIGETGLDYHWIKENREWQRERFRTHIHAAIETKNPLIIHTRDAREDTIKIMREENADKIGGVMHCFAETWDMAEQTMALGFYISFSGIVTFKNATELKEIAKKVPLNRMLVETDAPYLTPTPYRGKPNQPGYTRYVAEHIAELRGIEFAEIAKQTTKNYFDLFHTKS